MFSLGQCSDRQLHVGLGKTQVGLVAQQIGLGHGHIGIGFFPFFAGNRRTFLERPPSPFLALPLPEQRLAGDNRCFRLSQRRLRHFHCSPGMFHRQGVARGIDFE
ncbi:hypothetical protein D3C85_1272540 [compost metagenome]